VVKAKLGGQPRGHVSARPSFRGFLHPDDVRSQSPQLFADDGKPLVEVPVLPRDPRQRAAMQQV
jgi:hypothetical protein